MSLWGRTGALCCSSLSTTMLLILTVSTRTSFGACAANRPGPIALALACSTALAGLASPSHLMASLAVNHAPKSTVDVHVVLGRFSHAGCPGMWRCWYHSRQPQKRKKMRKMVRPYVECN